MLPPEGNLVCTMPAEGRGQTTFLAPANAPPPLPPPPPNPPYPPPVSSPVPKNPVFPLYVFCTTQQKPSHAGWSLFQHPHFPTRSTILSFCGERRKQTIQIRAHASSVARKNFAPACMPRQVSGSGAGFSPLAASVAASASIAAKQRWPTRLCPAKETRR